MPIFFFFESNYEYKYIIDKQYNDLCYFLLTGFSCAYLIFISDTMNNLFPIMSRYEIEHSSFEYLSLKTVIFIDISTHLGPVSLKTFNVTN